MKRLALTVMFVANVIITILAADIEVGGLKYDKLEDGTLCVVRSYVTGVVDIPEHVMFEGKNYVVTQIGELAFENCEYLKSVTIPNSVTSIGDEAFEFCTRLSSVTIPNSVTSIGWGAFRACVALTSVTIPNSVTSLGSQAFYYCQKLKSVTIGNSVTKINWATFYKCEELEYVTIPNSVTSIESQAFKGCTSLRSVTIPASITFLGDEAFADCSNRIIVYYPTTNPISASINVFSNNSYSDGRVCVLNEAVRKFMAIAPWKYFDTIQSYDFSGVEEVNNDTVAVYVSNRTIHFDNVAGLACRVIQLDGSEVYFNCSNDKQKEFTPSASGIYLAIVGSKSYKMMIQD